MKIPTVLIVLLSDAELRGKACPGVNSGYGLAPWRCPVVRLLTAFLLVVLLSFSSGCSGAFFVGGAINPNTQTVSGLITVVHVSISSDGSFGTIVTFVSSGAATSVNFCGDQHSQFPMNQFVQASFNPGTPCANLIVVVAG